MLACQSGSSDTAKNYEMGMESRAAMPASDAGQASGSEQPTKVEIRNPKIIRNGSMNISVKDALKAKTKVDGILAKHKAYVGNEQLDNNDYQTSYHLQIRVPAPHMDSLIADLETIDGTLLNKSINATDVTEEYIDLETRLTNKRAYLDQYRQLLKTARTIEDILKVREQIRVLEEEIESAEGRLNYLSNQVDLSTLDLTLTEQKSFVYKPERKLNFIERFKESMATGWYGFVDLSIYVFGLWPFWIILVVLLWWWRRSRKNKVKS